MAEAILPHRQSAREQVLRLVGLTIGALFVAFAALGAVFFWYDNAVSWTDHTRNVRMQIEEVLHALTDAESAQRGLLLVEDPRFEGQLQAARTRAGAALSRLQTLTLDNPSQQRRIAELGVLEIERLAVIDRTVALARAERRDEAVAVMRQGAGLRAMSAVRALTAELQAEEARLETKRAARAQAIRALLIVALAVFAIALTLLFVRVVRDISLDREAEAQVSEELRNLLRQRTLLLDEVNHRVKNSLQQVASVIRLQSRTVRHADARAALDDALGRIMAVGRVHEQLYRSGSEVGVFEVTDYIAMLATELVDSMARDDIELQLDLTPAALSLDQAIPMALILNELVTNALKYGCQPDTKSCLRVGFSAQQGEYRLSVADDGPGVPEDFKPQVSKSLGMRVIDALAKQLNGRLVVEHPLKGAEFAVVFPKGVQ